MPVEMINLQRKFPIDPLCFGKIAELGLASLNQSKNQVVLIFVNDQRMRHLNKTFRGKRKTTDVLSFSYQKERFLKDMGSPDGEVVISLQQAKRQADDAGIPLFDEIVNLIIHGLCHLKGYDHEIGEREASLMKKVERKTARFIQQGYQQWLNTQPEHLSNTMLQESLPSFKGKIPDDFLQSTKKSLETNKGKEHSS
jgi:probable rRNA maturation factor